MFTAMEHLLEVLKILDGALSADRKKVVSYAEQLAAKLEAKGDAKAADGIRRTIRRGRTGELTLSRLAPSLPVDSESRLALADERVFKRGDVDVVLNERTRARVDEFVRHVQGSDQLLAHGVGIAPSALIFGPPGCGKTELAKQIASELELPLLTARTDTLISSYLGSTSKNIRLLFEHAMGRPCVLFLDEVDAVAKLRDDQHELGELKRVVVSLLQNIDALDNQTVLVAATNHEHLLDRALWRRFAFHVRIDLPPLEARVELLRRFMGSHLPRSIEVEHLAAAMEDVSGAEIRNLCEDARRTAILSRSASIGEVDLLRRILRARVADVDNLGLSEQIAAARRLSTKLFTVRRLGELFSISTGKVSMLLREPGES